MIHIIFSLKLFSDPSCPVDAAMVTVITFNVRNEMFRLGVLSHMKASTNVHVFATWNTFEPVGFTFALQLCHRDKNLNMT